MILKVTKVKSIVDQELGYYQGDTTVDRTNKGLSSLTTSFPSGKTAYLYIHNKRVVGFCTVEIISKAFRLHSEDDTTSNSYIANRSTKAQKAMMGVHQLWCGDCDDKEEDCDIFASFGPWNFSSFALAKF